MNLTPIKNYALSARREFMQAISERAALFGITQTHLPEISFRGDVAMVDGKAVSRTVGQQCVKLCDKIRATDYDHVLDQVAYSWFNRLMAIRYMELHDYLDHGYRVLSSRDADSDQPEILRYAEQVDLPGLNRDKVVELKLDGTKDAELFRDVLMGQCHALQQAMPFLFESIEDETELLLPENLLHSDSLVRQLVTEIPEEDWDNIEIIGWLYQFYISEKKDQVIGKVVKSEDIPAATQLFTPNWIVKYMVQNSLGAQWMATYPNSPLKAEMEYYIEPAEQTDEVNAQLKAITPDSLNPEELTLIDPASGSGHILVEAYELFKAIYLERGYRQRDVPQLILEKNLFGLDIDGRAAQLTGFALMMKGRADDRRLFERGVKLNVMALVDSTDFDVVGLAASIKLSDYGLTVGDLNELKDLFEHATTFGSLIQVPEELAAKLPTLIKLSDWKPSVGSTYDWTQEKELKRLVPLVQQADLLTAQYDAVVANPPYIGSKFHVPVLKAFLKDNYKGYEKDVFSAFIDRGLAFSKPHGQLGFMSPFVWMFLSSYEHLRSRLVSKETITSLVQLEYSGFAGATVPICSFTLRKSHITGEQSCFIRLSDFPGSYNQGPKTLEAIRNRDCIWFFEAKQDDFKKIPGCLIAYWVAEAFVAGFTNPGLGTRTKGEGKNVTADNDRFLRFHWEVSVEDLGRNSKWLLYAKGGDFRKWSGNLEHVCNWSAEARLHYRKNHSSRIIDEEFWYLKGLTWTVITSSAIGFRLLPEDTTFDTKGLALFFREEKDLQRALLLANSVVGQAYLRTLNQTFSINTEHVKAIPYLSAVNCDRLVLRSLIEYSKIDWDAYERSWDFQSLPILTASSEPNSTFESSYTAWVTQNRKVIAEMKRLEEENNRLFIDAYGLADELTPDVPIEQVTLTVNPAYRYGGKLTEEQLWIRFREDTMQELVSYAIGCMMGRYSLDAPGLIYAHSGNEGFDPTKYNTFSADDDGIIPLTDTEWFDDDAAHRIVAFISKAWNSLHLEENLTFLADNLSPKKDETPRETIRRYLCDKFFTNHTQTYKKRPIYWLFSSGKQKAFQCLVYLHRYNEGTLARMRTEYVVPLLGRIPRRIEDLDQEMEHAGSTAQQSRLRKQKDKLGKQLDELRHFDEQLRHAADQRITLDLDDGVKVNYGKFGNLLADVKKITGKK